MIIIYAQKYVCISLSRYIEIIDLFIIYIAIEI